MLKQNAIRTGAVIATCAATSFISTGCRSLPGVGMFGSRGGPSAEALAGSGPSATYPVPPSHTATPESIASIAGGTAAPKPSFAGAADQPTAQVAGIEISPGYALPAGVDPGDAANMAAAEANGAFGLPATATPPSFAAESAPTGIASTTSAPTSFSAAPTPSTGMPSGMPGGLDQGSSFDLPGGANGPTEIGTPTGFASTDSTPGLSGFAPTPPSVEQPGSQSGPSGYAFGSKALTPKPTFTSDTAAAPESNFGLPTGPVATPSTSTASLPPADYAQPPAGGGFALPNDGPAMAAITQPDPPSMGMDAATPASTGAPLEVAAPEASPVLSTARVPQSSTSGGYGPGSTGTSGGYPTSNSTPSTSGSFYR